MEIKLLIQRCMDAFKEYPQLVGWGIGFNNSKTRFGLCKGTIKRIEFNFHYASTADESHVWGTFLHELAHALTPGQGHNIIWQKMAEKLGTSSQRTCGDSHLLPAAGWKAVCSHCVTLYERHKAPPKGKILSCSKPTCKGRRLFFVKQD